MFDGGMAAVLSDVGVGIEATGPAIGPTGSTIFAFPIVGGEMHKVQLGGTIERVALQQVATSDVSARKS